MAGYSLAENKKTNVLNSNKVQDCIIQDNMVRDSIVQGWLNNVEKQYSSHFDQRPEGTNIDLLVIHNISLPPGQFGGPYITDLFMGRLDPSQDSFFEGIYQLRVSAHCLIRRDGEIIQYVNFDQRAWHAGVSKYRGKERCNDFSIGIELEGTDNIPYTKQQYQQLVSLVIKLRETYPLIKDNIVGHCDIAPGRKTDPGPSFDWQYFNQLLAST
ncbi:1,6-anhydro-N-acetylmuramyl-L-alanine amidase AmpD [Endozoicomonas sp. G2_1]|uniref:1,6-anhydro-N-acetylmuramyl-L-alanine amidase AmpD n=1 Tax=Endozoicomonas sp. G2_1 TaxID=2821091 RepID=UPI001FFDFF68|nr:1,6-anhydro-N-acetylmuramyl-L-alanine amidase AmpD [Endozoicomonas sp. G2_1]